MLDYIYTFGLIEGESPSVVSMNSTPIYRRGTQPDQNYIYVLNDKLQI
jgi:hypothetical protein